MNVEELFDYTRNDYMTCSCYANAYCVNGYCPSALYHQYGPDCGYIHVTCDECGMNSGFCIDCMFEFSDICPIDWLFAEAVPFYDKEW